MPTDGKLRDGFRANDKYALSHVYYENIKHLYCYGKKFTRDDELVKDTIQELFYDLIRTRNNLSSCDNIRFYLFKSLRRKLIRKLTNAKKISITNEFNEQSDATIVYSYEEDWISRENTIQNKKLLFNALNKISPKQREIIYYRFNCDFKYEQICEIMSIKYDSARKMVFRALKSLKEHLQETGILV